MNNSSSFKFRNFDRKITSDFEQLNDLTKQEEIWNRAIFTLFPDGDFEITFEYDKELATEIERLSQ